MGNLVNICTSYDENHEISLKITRLDQLPLTFKLTSDQKLSSPLVVLSINILSQKLVGDELPSYIWKNSPEMRVDLIDERCRLMTKFLDKVY